MCLQGATVHDVIKHEMHASLGICQIPMVLRLYAALLGRKLGFD